VRVLVTAWGAMAIVKKARERPVKRWLPKGKICPKSNTDKRNTQNQDQNTGRQSEEKDLQNGFTEGVFKLGFVFQ